MRYAYATWLTGHIREHGIGVEDDEMREVEEAEFRIYGTVRISRSDVPTVRSDVEIQSVAPWEREVLTSVAPKLVGTLAKRTEGDGHDE